MLQELVLKQYNQFQVFAEQNESDYVEFIKCNSIKITKNALSTTVCFELRTEQVQL